MQSFSWVVGAAGALLTLLALAPSVTAQCPTDTGDWLLFKDSCYKYYNQSEFWFDAETTCKESNGHLTSIKSDHENRLVAKMAFCRDVWIGRYAVNLRKLADVSSYEWSDESKGDAYDRLKFAESTTVHQSLIRSVGLSWQNSLYHERHPFVCKVPSTSEQAAKCPSSMRYYQDSCYLISGFEATFIEANFFCQNRSLHVASVLNEAELRFMNAMDLEVDACELQSTWIGLVKLNPCFPDRGGRELCYQWTDYSGKHLNFPLWAEGQPAADNEAGSDQNCVIVSGNQLLSDKCHARHKFVCKAPASSLTAGSPVWQILNEPPVPIDESNNEKNPPVTEPAPIETSTMAETTPATESIEPTTVTMMTETTPATEAPAETTSTETPNNGAPEPESVAPASDATVGSYEPANILNRKKRDVARNNPPSHPLPAAAESPADKAKVAASKSRRGQDDNDAIEDRYPWSLGSIIANLFGDAGKNARLKERPAPTTMPSLPKPSPRVAEFVEPALEGHF